MSHVKAPNSITEDALESVRSSITQLDGMIDSMDLPDDDDVVPPDDVIELVVQFFLLHQTEDTLRHRHVSFMALPPQTRGMLLQGAKDLLSALRSHPYLDCR